MSRTDFWREAVVRTQFQTVLTSHVSSNSQGDVRKSDHNEILAGPGSVNLKRSQEGLVYSEFSDPKNIKCANTVLEHIIQQKPQPREHA